MLFVIENTNFFCKYIENRFYQKCQFCTSLAHTMMRANSRLTNKLEIKIKPLTIWVKIYNLIYYNVFIVLLARINYNINRGISRRVLGLN